MKNNFDKLFKITKINNSITTKKHKGASIPLQKQWKGFTLSQRTVNKILHKDTDRDGVPDRWDCQPRNPWKQDTKKEINRTFTINSSDLSKEHIKNFPQDINLYYKERMERAKIERINKRKLEFTNNLEGYDKYYNEARTQGLSIKNSDKYAKTFLQKKASINKQKEWKNMSNEQKTNIKKLLPDTDKDGVPNGYDCEPYNKNKQDSYLIDYVDKGLKPVAHITDYNDNLKKYALQKGLKIINVSTPQYDKQYYVYKDDNLKEKILEKDKFDTNILDYYEKHKNEKDVDLKIKKYATEQKKLQKYQDSFGSMLGYPEKSVESFMKTPDDTAINVRVKSELEGKNTKDWDYLEFAPTGLTYEEAQKYAQERKQSTTNKPSYANYHEIKYITQQIKNNPNLTIEQAKENYYNLSYEDRDKLFKEEYGQTQEEYNKDAYLETR